MFSFEAVNLGFDFAEFVLGFLCFEVLFTEFCGDVSLKLASYSLPSVELGKQQWDDP